MNRAVIDIETVPIASNEDDCTASNVTDEQLKKAALDALSGQIVCIGLLLTKEYDADSAVALVSTDERALLARFWSSLAQEKISSFVAHNGLNFDLPFLWKRSVIHNVRPSLNLDLRRYRTDLVFDTMAVWANWDPRNFPSLDALARSLGLGCKNGSGEQVLELWKTGMHAEIARYCLHDCWLTYGCYCRMNFKTPTPETSVPFQVEILDKNLA